MYWFCVNASWLVKNNSLFWSFLAMGGYDNETKELMLHGLAFFWGIPGWTPIRSRLAKVKGKCKHINKLLMMKPLCSKPSLTFETELWTWQTLISKFQWIKNWWKTLTLARTHITIVCYCCCLLLFVVVRASVTLACWVQCDVNVMWMDGWIVW